MLRGATHHLGDPRFAPGDPPDRTVITRQITPEEAAHYGIDPGAPRPQPKDRSGEADGIRAALRAGEPVVDIARQFDVSEARVRGILGHMPKAEGWTNSRSWAQQRRDIARQIETLRQKIASLEKRAYELDRLMKGEDPT